MFIQITDIDERGHHINLNHVIKITCTSIGSRIYMTGDYQIDITSEEFLNNVYPNLYPPYPER